MTGESTTRLTNRNSLRFLHICYAYLMSTIEIKHEVSPEARQDVPASVRSDIEDTILSLERDEQRFSTTFLTGIALLAAKHGFNSVNKTLSTISGFGAAVAGGASVGFGLKYLVNSIRNRKKTYTIREKHESGK